MGHHVRSLLLVAVVFGAAAAMAARAEDDDAMPPIPEFHMDFPPLPSPADIPAPPPCMNSTTTACSSVYLDNSTIPACCAAVRDLYSSEPTCLCDAVAQAQKLVKQYGLNGTIDGLEIFRQCDMSTGSCDGVGKSGEVDAFFCLYIRNVYIYGLTTVNKVVKRLSPVCLHTL
jgi:hypothetical protein